MDTPLVLNTPTTNHNPPNPYAGANLQATGLAPLKMVFLEVETPVLKVGTQENNKPATSTY